MARHFQYTISKEYVEKNCCRRQNFGEEKRDVEALAPICTQMMVFCCKCGYHMWTKHYSLCANSTVLNVMKNKSS